ncbi:ribonuclease P protein component [Flavobacterium silvaticum]|uniref:Ribonuclease P protein component n=1 Tax=Flavobacterium silvaticum TaxID=1852020 RepID=A0A972JJT8_9FLAO|nr:ribonuclease P protein component [Flavobacterium silvaticum]NMH28437.1 ribonuclease P protein component [Flavobacterium silvaticum]
MDRSYPNSEKLKSRLTIERLFREGKSVSKYPLRLVFIPIEDSVSKIQVGVSVPKKFFKKAHDRNLIKRRLREAYRHNKSLLIDAAKSPVACMIVYSNSETMSYADITVKIEQLFKKFADLQNEAEAHKIDTSTTE